MKLKLFAAMSFSKKMACQAWVSLCKAYDYRIREKEAFSRQRY
ncbi:MAG: hypothetical protein NT178_16295 [Proteobacteria bacterium]|nr:hypothetical protein [Pseudomonadota bacterium]